MSGSCGAWRSRWRGVARGTASLVEHVYNKGPLGTPWANFRMAGLDDVSNEIGLVDEFAAGCQEQGGAAVTCGFPA